MKLHIFWNWAALNPISDTYHFRIFNNQTELYVDGGHGQNLAQRVLRKEINQPENLFVTHCHTDHLLGVPQILRIVQKPLNIYCSENMEQRIKTLMNLVWKRMWKKINWPLFKFHYNQDKVQFNIDSWTLEPIDLYSQKDEQFGFIFTGEGKKIVCFWDESIDVMKRDDLERFKDCDWLLCEAFCSEQNKELFDPHPKAHITAKEAAEIAVRLKAKNLVVTHIAEKIEIDRSNQFQIIESEIAKIFKWGIFVPHDDTVINL